jgi:hypothetical protein
VTSRLLMSCSRVHLRFLGFEYWEDDAEEEEEGDMVIVVGREKRWPVQQCWRVVRTR